MHDGVLFRRLLIGGTCLWVAILALAPYLILLAASFLARGTDTLVVPGLTLANYLHLLDPAVFGMALDSIALADDAADPLDSPADDSPVTADDSPATAGNGHGDLDDFAGDLPDELIDDPTAAAHADDLDGFGAGTVDDGTAEPSSSIGEADPEMEW